jgi:hypothetical protein
MGKTSAYTTLVVMGMFWLTGHGVALQSLTIGDQVVKFCKENLGKKVGGGQCAHLATEAVKSAGGKSWFEFKDFPNQHDYVWGDLVYVLEVKGKTRSEQKVPGRSVQPGNVIQMRDAEFEGTDYMMSAPHHTSVVIEVKENGSVLTAIEQNHDGKMIVNKTTYRLNDLKAGWVRIYEPVPKQ